MASFSGELNLLESVAQILSRALTDEETERVITRFHAFNERLRQLSEHNLQKLQSKRRVYPSIANSSNSDISGHSAESGRFGRFGNWIGWSNTHKRDENAVFIESLCRHSNGCAQNAVRGFVKAFVVSFFVKASVGFLPHLLTGAIFRKPNFKVHMQNLAGKDTFRFALFIAAFISIYKASLCSLRAATNSNHPVNSFLAGAAAGSSLLLDSNKNRRIAIALYLTVRLGDFLARAGWRRWVDGVRTEYEIDEERRSLAIESPPEEVGMIGTSTAALNSFEDAAVSMTLSSVSAKTLSGDLSFEPAASVDGYFPQMKLIPTPISTSLGRPKSIIASYEEEEDEISSPLSPTLKALNLQNGVRPPSLVRSYSSNPSLNLPLTPSHKQILKRIIAPILMSVASTQIIYAFVAAQHTLPRQYLGFLTTQSGLRKSHGKRANAFFTLANGMIPRCQGENGITSTLKDLHNHSQEVQDCVQDCKDAGLFNYGGEDDMILCKVQHYFTDTCTGFARHVFVEELGRAFNMYAPLNLVMLLLFRPKKILSQPFKTAASLTKSTIRSSVFLATYVTIAWSMPCAIRRYFRKDLSKTYLINGALCALGVLIETPGRQLELAYYCLPRAIESFFQLGIGKGWWNGIPNGEVIYFCFATGALMSLYQNEEGSISNGYRRFMTRFFGVN